MSTRENNLDLLTADTPHNLRIFLARMSDSKSWTRSHVFQLILQIILNQLWRVWQPVVKSVTALMVVQTTPRSTSVRSVPQNLDGIAGASKKLGSCKIGASSSYNPKFSKSGSYCAPCTTLLCSMPSSIAPFVGKVTERSQEKAATSLICAKAVVAMLSSCHASLLLFCLLFS